MPDGLLLVPLVPHPARCRRVGMGPIAPVDGVAQPRPAKSASGPEMKCVGMQGGGVCSLDDAGISWEMAIEGGGQTAIEATVSADLAVHASLDGMAPSFLAQVDDSAGLPRLDELQINLYRGELGAGQAMDDLIDLITAGYRMGQLPQVVSA